MSIQQMDEDILILQPGIGATQNAWVRFQLTGTGIQISGHGRFVIVGSDIDAMKGWLEHAQAELAGSSVGSVDTCSRCEKAPAIIRARRGAFCAVCAEEELDGLNDRIDAAEGSTAAAAGSQPRLSTQVRDEHQPRGEKPQESPERSLTSEEAGSSKTAPPQGQPAGSAGGLSHSSPDTEGQESP